MPADDKRDELVPDVSNFLSSQALPVPGPVLGKPMTRPILIPWFRTTACWILPTGGRMTTAGGAYPEKSEVSGSAILEIRNMPDYILIA